MLEGNVEMTARQNILVTVVGDRDPLPHDLFVPADEAQFEDNLAKHTGPILETLELFEREPNWVQYPIHQAWLLFTKDEEDKKIYDRVEWLVSYFRGKGISTQEIDLRVANPSDYRLLIPSMNKAVSRIKRENKQYQEPNFFVLTSPGTPQMSATWIILGNEGRLAGTFLQKIPGDKLKDNETKRIMKRLNSGRLETIPLSPFFEHEKVKQIADLLTKHMAFASCSDLLSDLATSTLFEERKRLFNSAHLLCRLFDQWDKNHNTAMKLCQDNEYLLRLILDRIDTDLFDQISACLELLAEKELTASVLAVRVKNLLALADRKRTISDHNACVMNAFLAYETILAGTLQLPPYNLRDAGSYDTLSKEDNLLGVHSKPAHQGMKRVKPNPGDFKDNESSDLYAKASALRRTRNNIIHWGLQVDAPKATTMLQNAREVISVFLNVSIAETERFPFNGALASNLRKKIQEVARLS